MALITCPICGKDISDSAVSCVNCGSPIIKKPARTVCPDCGGIDVDCQVFQENLGGSTVTKTESRYKQKGHGCLWWLIIGWWWWIVDLCLWVFFFIPRLLIQIFKRKKYKGSSTSVSVTTNKIEYKTIFFCKSCGNRWERSVR